MTKNQTNGEDEFTPHYQRGRTSVEHRNIDAAGADHPFGDEPRSFEADLRHLIRKVADDLYESWEATIREYLANAETATLRVEQYLEDPSGSPFDDMIVDETYEPKIEVTWNRKEEDVTIKDNGIGMAASEVDEIFRKIGHSAARDDGTKSGQFGMGALSFVKLVGLDNAMIMTSHSRLNDDNAAYYVTLAGVEPIRGQLADDEYWTKFQMTPDDEYNVRQAVEKYAEWMRVPVIYREIDEEGTEVFNEDWGDKALYDDYEENRICIQIKKDHAFEAYCSPESSGKTLLLSMDIDRNDGRHSSGQHGAPFPFDIRLLDESGKIIESSNGNEGLMPCPRSDYESMLIDARDPYITEELLNNADIVGQEVEEGPNRGRIVVDDSVLDRNKPLPQGDYVAASEISPDDEPGEAEVLIGPNQGRVVISEEEWEELDPGRAALYVPEDQLDPYTLSSGEGDLALPEPTSDRDRLQSHETFWKYVGQQFGELFDEKVDEIYELIDGADDPLEAIMNVEEENLSLALRGIREIPTGRRRRASSIAEAINQTYGTDISETVASVLDLLRRTSKPIALLKAYKMVQEDGCFEDRVEAYREEQQDEDDDEEIDVSLRDALKVLDTALSSGLAPRSKGGATTKKRARESVRVYDIVTMSYPDGDVYMAKSTGGAFVDKAKIAWDLNDNNHVVVVNDYDKWERLFGWKKLKEFPHGWKKIREELGDELSVGVLNDVAPKPVQSDDSDSDSSDQGSQSTSRREIPPEKKELNVARSRKRRDRFEVTAENIASSFGDDGTLGTTKPITQLILFPTTIDKNMSDHWWIPGWIDYNENEYAAIARCNKSTYEYLQDVDQVMHIDEYLDQASGYVIETTEGPMTLPKARGDLVLHIVSQELREYLTRDSVFSDLPKVLPEFYNENNFHSIEFPDPENIVYAPVTNQDVFWLRPLLQGPSSEQEAEDQPIVLKSGVSIRDIYQTNTVTKDFKLYARARLSDWDFEWTELDMLDSMAYRYELDDGGFEFVETLGLLHDMGEKPFSQRVTVGSIHGAW